MSSMNGKAVMPLSLAAFALLSGCDHGPRGLIVSGGREVESWIADLHDPESPNCRRAVLKPANVGDFDPAAADRLANASRDTDALVRRDAIRVVPTNPRMRDFRSWGDKSDPFQSDRISAESPRTAARFFRTTHSRSSTLVGTKSAISPCFGWAPIVSTGLRSGA